MRLINVDDFWRILLGATAERDVFDLVEIDDMLTETPTIEAEPVRHGRWGPHPLDKDWDTCSSCGFGTKRREHSDTVGDKFFIEFSYSYCPRCGARMDMEVCDGGTD